MQLIDVNRAKATAAGPEFGEMGAFADLSWA
jgi:hypothetical protein